MATETVTCQKIAEADRLDFLPSYHKGEVTLKASLATAVFIMPH